MELICICFYVIKCLSNKQRAKHFIVVHNLKKVKEMK